MKKTIITILCVAVAFLSFCACDKITETEFWWQYTDLESLQYILGEESTVDAFIDDLCDIIDKYDGKVNYSMATIKRETESVVKKYNWGELSGTFKLKESIVSDSGPWTTYATFTLNFNSKYKVKSTDVEIVNVKRTAD